MAISRLFTKKYPISQKFGNYLNGYYSKWGMKWHDGVDFATPVWTPVMAGLDGIVRVPPFMATWYGHYLIVEKTRTDGVSELLFAHLSKIIVKTWESVKKDQIIGYTWNSWGSTWPHLHFSLKFKDLKWNVLNKNNGFKWAVDPMPYFE